MYRNGVVIQSKIESYLDGEYFRHLIDSEVEETSPR